MANSTISLKGKVFGQLTIIDRVYVGGKPKWSYVCSCGQTGAVNTSQLTKKDKPKTMCNTCVRKKPRIPIKNKAIKRHYQGYTNNARSANRDFELSLQEFESLVVQDCTYCGAPPRPSGIFEYPMNGVDRIDSEIGYLSTNCTPCCTICNMMKRTLSMSKWFAHMKQILEFNKETIL